MTATPETAGTSDTAPEDRDLPVSFLVEGSSSRKRRNDVRVHMTRPWQLHQWELVSDEPPDHGGEETAPQPLAIFAAALAGRAVTLPSGRRCRA